MRHLVRRPVAGNPPVRFDQRGVETEPKATAPLLDSTFGYSEGVKNQKQSLTPSLQNPRTSANTKDVPVVAFKAPKPRRGLRMSPSAFFVFAPTDSAEEPFFMIDNVPIDVLSINVKGIEPT